MPRGAKGLYEVGKGASQRVIEVLKLGMTQQAACNVAGIHVDTFHEWMKKHPEFAEAVKSARDDGKAEALELIKAAAKDPRHWQAAAWYLERSFPQEYRQRVGVDVDRAQLEAEVRAMAEQMGLTLNDTEAQRAVEAATELLRKS